MMSCSLPVVSLPVANVMVPGCTSPPRRSPGVDPWHPRRTSAALTASAPAAHRWRVGLEAMAMRLLPPIPLREALEGLELVVDAMSQQGSQHATAGNAHGLEMREAGPFAFRGSRHPHHEETALHEAPAGAQHGPQAQADAEVGADHDVEMLAVSPQDSEAGDVLLPQRRRPLEVAGDAPDIVERRIEHALAERGMRQRGNQDPHAAHRIEIGHRPDAGLYTHVVHSFRKTARARCSRDFTVPRATPSTCAASASLRPCTSRSTRMAR